MLSALIPIVRRCDEQFNEQTVANSLYGLQGMKRIVPVVLEMLSELIPKVRSCSDHCSDQFKGQAVANALYWLQGMSSEVPVVVELLSVLIPKVKSCSDKLTGQNVANALYGLQGMSSNVPVVAELLSALIPIAQNLVVELLSVLVLKAQIVELRFAARHIGNILYGLQNMKYELSRDFADALVAQVLKSDTSDAPFYHESQGFVSLNVALNSLVQSGAYNSASKIEDVLTNLTVALERQPCPVTWGGVSVEVTSNVWLHGFEADIPVAIIIYVEINGPHHRSMERQRLTCKKSDMFLVELGAT
eukprot:gene26700-35378_t